MMDKVKQQGITLIELLIVIVIISVLAAILYPNFSNSARKANRSDALKSMQEVAHKLEKHMTFCNEYTIQFGGTIGENASGDSCTGLGLSAVDALTLSSELDVYDLSINCVTGAGGGCMAYEITALAKGSQANDVACQRFIMSSTGEKTSRDSSNNDSSSQCWS